jgi:hypothetical protein
MKESSIDNQKQTFDSHQSTKRDKPELSNRIKSSVMFENRKFYDVVIELPRIEYRVESENFTIAKALTLDEVLVLCRKKFINW